MHYSMFPDNPHFSYMFASGWYLRYTDLCFIALTVGSQTFTDGRWYLQPLCITVVQLGERKQETNMDALNFPPKYNPLFSTAVAKSKSPKETSLFSHCADTCCYLFILAVHTIEGTI